ncbi:MAG: carbohydrate kinase family protein [Ignavibacteria bacterium]|jgi:sugar/nucleoside kinase (ribokinase family)
MNVNDKKFDVIVVGELNVDLILNKLESFPEIGKEKLADEMTLTLGSSSAIFASNLSALGAKVAFLGKIGDDYFGDLVIDTLQSKGVDVSMIIRDDKLKTGATIILNFDEDRAMVTHPGAMNELRFEDITAEKLLKAKHLHFSSYYLQPGLKKNVGEMFKLAKISGLTTSFDMQWDPAEKWDFDYKHVLPNVDVFLPNEKETANLTGKEDLTDSLEELSPYSNTVMVKMGSKGSVSWAKGNYHKMGAFLNSNVVDAIGAGDSFNAGFIFKFIKGEAINKCQEFGNLTGAINTTAAGGTTAFTSFDEIMKIAEEKFGYKS